MKTLVMTSLAMVWAVVGGCQAQSNNAAAAQPISVTSGLVQRVLPDEAGTFIFETIPSDAGKDVFEIDMKPGKTTLRGSNAIAQASAFNWYLKHASGRQISTRGDQLVHKTLDLQRVRRTSPYAVRGQMNYCTFCYTCANWGWPEWEREIDRMAMNGVNAPLMCVGNEKVWQNVLRRLNYREDDIQKFIPGCDFTAWWLMGNMEGEGGPLPQSMIDREADLAQKILSRMREYGMQPVLQGFCGLVPTTFASYYPNAKVIPQGKWAGGYERPSVLSPLDPMFAQVAQIWYEEQEKLYGKSKYYGGDLFHEGGKSAGLSLAECAKAVQGAQQKHVPGAVWVLQGWSGNPKGELLAATLPDQTLVQQLTSYPSQVSLAGFQDRPWIFAGVNNFGGHETWGGSLKALATLPSQALAKPNHNLVGLGLLDEALDSHPALWDMFSDAVWSTEDIDLEKWCSDYPIYRYGKSNADASAAWRILGMKVMAERPRENPLCARPSLSVRSTSSWGSIDSKQNPNDTIEAAELLLKASNDFKEVPTYRHDVVDVVRQVMQDNGYYLYQAMVNDYQAGHRDECRAKIAQFRQLLSDFDRLLSSDPNFLLGNWIDLARRKGATKEESDHYERMARQLITLWTPKPTDLSDYAYKNYAGLMKDYYLPRWENFLTQMEESLEDRSIKPRYNAQAAEIDWVKQTNSYLTQASGDPIALANEFLAKYAQPTRELAKAYEAEAKRWSWSLANSTEKKQTLTWDITDRIQAGGAGTYRVRVEYERGNKAIMVSKVTLMQTVDMAIDGTIVAEDVHDGRSGAVTKDNVYTLKLDKISQGAKYILKIAAEGDNGNDSHGRIVITK